MVIDILKPVHDSTSDLWLKSRLAGLVTVEAVSSFELAIKQLLIEFCKSRDNVFGSFAERRFQKLNGRIKISDIKGEYLTPLGGSYAAKFEMKLTEASASARAANRDDPALRYQALLQNRHSFVHTGSLTITFDESVEYFRDACIIPEALKAALASESSP